MKDAWIEAPPATLFIASSLPTKVEDGLGITPEDLIHMQQAEIRWLRSEMEKLRITANTIANTAAALSYLAQQAQPDPSEWVTIPKEVRLKMQDVQLGVRSTEEGTQVRWLTRAPDHVFVGRADG